MYEPLTGLVSDASLRQYMDTHVRFLSKDAVEKFTSLLCADGFDPALLFSGRPVGEFEEFGTVSTIFYYANGQPDAHVTGFGPSYFRIILDSTWAHYAKRPLLFTTNASVMEVRKWFRITLRSPFKLVRAKQRYYADFESLSDYTNAMLTWP